MYLNTFIIAASYLMVKLYCDKYRAEDLAKTLDELEPDLNLPNIKTYDFIVVGGGTAGCIMAARLSEKFNVLLLEKGGPPPPMVDNPTFNDETAEDLRLDETDINPEINDVFLSIPQTHMKLANGGINNVTSGKMLGGSGSHNGNIYFRGSPFDYDLYANKTGDYSWMYKNIIQYFKKFENLLGFLINEHQRDSYGTSGPISVEANWPPFLDTWFEVANELGYAIADPNAYQIPSFVTMVHSTKSGIRSSSYNSYVKPIMGKRKSLTVLPYSEVDEILISRDLVAYGVRYHRHGIPQIAHVYKEVIISTSTFISPNLLVKSGIGPKHVLEAANINVKKDLQGVGKNLRDHVGVFLTFQAHNASDELVPVITDNKVETALYEFQSSDLKHGFYIRRDFAYTAAFLVSSVAKSKGESEYPDIQLNFKQSSPVRNSEDEPKRIAMHAVANRHEAKGTVGFNTTAYLAGERDLVKLAVIDYQFLTTASDRKVLHEAIEKAFSVINSNTLAFMDLRFNSTIPKACNATGIDFTKPQNTTRAFEFWDCFMQQTAGSWWHQVGTCKMGMVSDPDAVVDSKLRVIGVKKLRVVDASVLPFPTNANINAAVMLLAEKTIGEMFNYFG